jgi:hypothetical protein
MTSRRTLKVIAADIAVEVVCEPPGRAIGVATPGSGVRHPRLSDPD